LATYSSIENYNSTQIKICQSSARKQVFGGQVGFEPTLVVVLVFVAVLAFFSFA
jgi:hypothetical protein